MKNMITRFDIPSSNFNRAVKFYNTILETNMYVDKDPDGNDMAMFTNPNDMKPGENYVSGGISSGKNSKPGSVGITIYFDVTGKFDETLDRVVKAGGKISMPKMSIGEWGFIANIHDTEGNNIGLHSM